MSTLTKVTVNLGSVHYRTKEGEHDHETVGESEHNPCHPSGGVKLVEQQTERLYGDHLYECLVPCL